MFSFRLPLLVSDPDFWCKAGTLQQNLYKKTLYASHYLLGHNCECCCISLRCLRFEAEEGLR